MHQIRHPFFRVDLDPHHRQEGQRQHRQGDVPVPAVPTPNFVVSQADFLLGRFEALFNLPSLIPL
jgi:hypothetical protein